MSGWYALPLRPNYLRHRVALSVYLLVPGFYLYPRMYCRLVFLSDGPFDGDDVQRTFPMNPVSSLASYELRLPRPPPCLLELPRIHPPTCACMHPAIALASSRSDSPATGPLLNSSSRSKKRRLLLASTDIVHQHRSGAFFLVGDERHASSRTEITFRPSF
ncbi:hypothetical protein MSAN_01610000 [Mycena sanguinolenta]|uniref:Uncharacterized protein n=1 Tax=Mycena sanguinolenta TaxID=230812 RepID=A0A8H6Y3Z0_9AGAR|nr:hypothetical protein MSAN_01610000 [Mycena sanguinolenta]